MATVNGKKYSVELDGQEIKHLMNGIEKLQDVIDRQIARESNQQIRALREADRAYLQTLHNKIAYGGKELV